MSLKFCANLSFMFQETASLIERYILARKAGFRAVECAFPYTHTLQEIVDAKTKAGVDQVLINIYVGDISKGEFGFAAIPGKEEAFLDSISLSVNYAKALQCKIIHIMAGLVSSPSKDNDEVFEKNLRLAASVFEKEKIIGVIEPINGYSVPNYYMNDFNKALNVIKKINSPNLKLQLDLFHLQFLRGNLTNNVKDMLPYVGHIQIAQVPNRNEPDSPGEINYRFILSVLEEQHYEGWIGLEYKPASNTETGLKWIENFGYSL